ncbi:MAG: hypothetical protein DMD98_21705 [Candidatus Rokuibacteriota bacterium]|nr:MAG: hypothetical protein DMD98_21705 [Candidatus Rokubacteria bacterium]
MSALAVVVVVVIAANAHTTARTDFNTAADDQPRSDTLLKGFHLQGEYLRAFGSKSAIVHRPHLPPCSCVTLIRIHLSQ